MAEDRFGPRGPRAVDHDVVVAPHLVDLDRIGAHPLDCQEKANISEGVSTSMAVNPAILFHQWMYGFRNFYEMDNDAGERSRITKKRR
jgi:hypothetical protein